MPLLAELVIAAGAGYVIGAFPTAYVVGRVLKGRDIRQLGDGNVGAENAARVLGPTAGIAVGILDIFKGTLAVLIFDVADFAIGPQLLAGFMAVVGHTWPIFLKFKGGRGAATTLGVLIQTLYPASWAALVGILLLLMRKSTLTACAAAFVLLQPIIWGLGYPVYLALYALGLPVMVGLIHLHQVILPAYQRTGQLSLRPKQ